jgi:hypothetical protein
MRIVIPIASLDDHPAVEDAAVTVVPPLDGRVDAHSVSSAMPLGVHGPAVPRAQEVLEQDLQRLGQPGDVEVALEGVEPEDPVRLACDVEGAAGAQRVGMWGAHPQSSKNA